MPIDPLSPASVGGVHPPSDDGLPTAGRGRTAPDRDAFSRDGTSTAGVSALTDGLGFAGGAPARLAAAEVAFGRARDTYDAVWARWRGNGIAFYDPSRAISVPEEVRRACDTLLSTTAELLRARGVAVTVDRASGNLTILPDGSTPLGQYAAELSRYGEQAVVNPTLLWVQTSHGHHDLRNRMVFVSVEAIDEGRPGVTEGHELIHARLHHRFDVEQRYHLLNGWLTPVEGQTLFGAKRNYTAGFSLEELSTAAHDLLFETGGLERVQALAEHLSGTASYDRDAIADVRVAVAAADNYLGELDRPSLPQAVLSATERLLATAMAWAGGDWQQAASEYYDDFTRVDPATGQYERRQVLRSGGADVGLELTHYPLSDGDRRVVGALLSDRRSGVRLEVPILDPSALASMRAEPPDATALSALARRFLLPRLEALRDVARAQVDAYAQLRRAADSLRVALDTGTPYGPAAAAFERALAALDAVGRHDGDLEPQRRA